VSTTTIETPDTVDSARKSGEVVIEGLVDYPMTLTVLDMDYMDWATVTVDHPDLGATEYEGVYLSEIFWYTGVQTMRRTMVSASDGSTVAFHFPP
jgi:hypothetical protein